MRFCLRILCIPLLLSFSINAQVLIRGPYMNLATSNSIFIQWRTDLPCSGQVRFGTNLAALNNTFTNIANNTDHKIKLTGLTPGTKYYYSIGTSTMTFLSGSDLYFKTLPISSPLYEKPIRFWAVGDMSKQTQQQVLVKDAFKKYVDTSHIDGWIMLGDNAYETGTDSNYQNGFFNYYQNDITRHIVLWPVVGNHEYANDFVYRTSHQIAYMDIFELPSNGESGGKPSGNERYYSFDYGNVHFVNLDSYGLEWVNGNFYGLADTLLSPQIQWLKNDLDSNQLPWVIVSFHHPPYCMGTHNSDAELDLVAIRSNLAPILERYNVDIVLNGHSHAYERSGFMKGHYGMESTFDTTLHLRQIGSGKYDGSADACPYIKNSEWAKSSDSGSIYMVVGSGSAIPQAPPPTWPHDAMYYSNYLDNGSLLLEIEGNRLDATWISTDTNQKVKDHFTMFKHVNLTSEHYVHFPTTLTLKANWLSKNGYHWSTGESTQSITFPFTKDTMVMVTDTFGCIVDTFYILDSALVNGLNPSNDQLSIRTFPNPWDTYLMMEVSKSGRYDIAIADILGIRKMSLTNYYSKGTHPIPINPLWPKGIYMLSILYEKKEKVATKIVH